MDEPIQPPSKQPKRFFDIAPPKDFRPSATSRPIIVSNQPEQADPMMAPQALPVHHVPIAEQPSPVSNAPEAAPASDTDTPPASAEAIMQQEYNEVGHELTPDGQSASEPETATAPAAEVPANQAEEPVPMAPAPTTETPAVPTAVAQTTEPDTAEQTAAAAGTVSPVVVVHHHHSQSFAKELLVAVLIVALLVVALDVVLDAGIWKPGYNLPHTHFLHKS